MLCLSSCGLIKINGTTQGLTSYYNKSKAACGELFETTCYDDSTTLKKLVISNGIVIQRNLAAHSKSLVYLWSPKCKSKYCVSLNLLQERCNKDSMELIVVAEYYDCRLMQKSYTLKRPITGIDTKYYHTNLTAKYVKRFLKELTMERDFPKDRGRYFYFEKGRFVRNIKDISDL